MVKSGLLNFISISMTGTEKSGRPVQVATPNQLKKSTSGYDFDKSFGNEKTISEMGTTFTHN